MFLFANDTSVIAPYIGTILSGLGIAFVGLASWITWLTKSHIDEAKATRKELKEMHDASAFAQKEQREHFDRILNDFRTESGKTIEATRVEFRGALASVIGHCESESKEQAQAYQRMVDTLMVATGVRQNSSQQNAQPNSNFHRGQ